MKKISFFLFLSFTALALWSPDVLAMQAEVPFDEAANTSVALDPGMIDSLRRIFADPVGRARFVGISIGFFVGLILLGQWGRAMLSGGTKAQKTLMLVMSLVFLSVASTYLFFFEPFKHLFPTDLDTQLSVVEPLRVDPQDAEEKHEEEDADHSHEEPTGGTVGGDDAELLKELKIEADIPKVQKEIISLCKDFAKTGKAPLADEHSSSLRLVGPDKCPYDHWHGTFCGKNDPLGPACGWGPVDPRQTYQNLKDNNLL